MGLSRTTAPMQPSVPPGSSSVVTGTSSGGPFLGNQPQAAIMKQMLIEQRAQLHVMEQQKQQFLREQRQQQQQQILAEQVQHLFASSSAARAGMAAWALQAVQHQPFLLHSVILSLWLTSWFFFSSGYQRRGICLSPAMTLANTTPFPSCGHGNCMGF